MKTMSVLSRLFEQPTAPFREGWVIAEICRILKEQKIPYFSDSFGNLIAGVSSAERLRKKPRLALQAHTDHPGFHLLEPLGPAKWRALWFGGAPFQTMQGASLRIFDPGRNGVSHKARCVKVDSSPYSREGVPIVVETTARDLNRDCFGSFDFPALSLRGDLISSRAADDLAGVTIALGALIDQKGEGLAIFTRAEEVGFVGCMKLMESGLLHPKSWLLCLEASRELPLAQLGEGPVLRLGDRSTLYNSDFSIWMWKVAEDLKQTSKFEYQRRLLDGGSCEATAMSLYGYTTTGLAVPLRNYHNQGSSRPRPEVISLKDVEGARTLCSELYERFRERPLNSRALQKSLLKNMKQLTPLLRRRISYA